MTTSYDDLWDEIDSQCEPATTTERYLPAFVYGTLRAFCGNWEWCLRGKTVAEVPATLAGARMWSNGGFPFVSMNGAQDNQMVVGELMYIREDLFAEVLRDLDGLEGYRGPENPFNMYDRKIVTVTTADGEQVEAYTYLVGEQIYDSRLRECDPSIVVGHGDWVAYIAERRPGRGGM